MAYGALSKSRHSQRFTNIEKIVLATYASILILMKMKIKRLNVYIKSGSKKR